MKVTNTLYIPIELKVRELYPKLYLASRAAHLGFSSLLGPKNWVHRTLKASEGGVYFDKSIAINKLEKLQERSRSIEHLVSLDEEAGIQREGASFQELMERRMDASTLSLTSSVFCYGPYDRDHLSQQFPQEEAKFRLTGSPRIDLWKEKLSHTIFQDKISDIQKSHGDFILVNSSIGVTSPEKVEYLLQQSLEYGHIGEEDVLARREELKARFQAFEHLSETVQELAQNFPRTTFVVRPHPSEPVQDWEERINASNIHVKREGDVTPWIVASKAVIHESCTTAVQAKIAGKPVIAFKTDPSSQIQGRKPLPDRVSIITTGFEELQEAVAKVLKGGFDKEPMGNDEREALRERIYNLEIDGAQAIAEDLAELPLSPSKLILPGSKTLVGSLKNAIRSSAKKKTPPKEGPDSEGASNQANGKRIKDEKIAGGIAFSEVDAFYKALGSRFPELVKKLRYKEVAPSTFLIYAKG